METIKFECEVITSPQGADITLADGRSVINFCANNYLGLSSHPKVIQAAKKAIESLKTKFGGSELFGNEKDKSFKGSLQGIYQTFDSKELYPHIEEKAANLLYFVVKNHSFSDGNKRIAAFLFVWFLERNNLLYHNNKKVIDDNALVALTLMIAESKSDDKDMMVKVIINLINNK